MATSSVLDKVHEADILSEGRASAAPEELASFLEEAAPPPPDNHQKAAVWVYSVPLAGVRYYGCEGHPSPGTRTK
jgi:hypothetical protein